MDKKKLFLKIGQKIHDLKESLGDDSEVLEKVAELLRDEVEYYDWVGFYFAKPETEELELGPFAGDPTEHVKIDYGEGICGQSAETGEIFTVQDVSEEDNYLSCSTEVKSEIVVPVYHGGEFLGEIDIDSHRLEPFDSEDEQFLRALAEELSPFFGLAEF